MDERQGEYEGLGVADLISESFFCSHYASIWRSLTPSMEDCVRRYNLSEYDRTWAPLPSSTDASRRGLINEAAFIFFCERRLTPRDELTQHWKPFMEQAFEASTSFLQAPAHNATDTELREALAIAVRLQTYFSSSMSGQGELLISPQFAGCGIVGTCRGDVVKGSILHEVKAGDRNFRSIDFRQLLLYASLQFAKDRSIFSHISLVNPRTGITIRADTDTFTRDCSGLAPSELFERILDALSANLVSE